MKFGSQVLGNLSAMRYVTLRGRMAGASFCPLIVNRKVVLSVQDNGAGIAPDALPHIFERFYRGDASRQQSERNRGWVWRLPSRSWKHTAGQSQRQAKALAKAVPFRCVCRNNLKQIKSSVAQHNGCASHFWANQIRGNSCTKLAFAG